MSLPTKIVEQIASLYEARFGKPLRAGQIESALNIQSYGIKEAMRRGENAAVVGLGVLVPCTKLDEAAFLQDADFKREKLLEQKRAYYWRKKAAEARRLKMEEQERLRETVKIQTVKPLIEIKSINKT